MAGGVEERRDEHVHVAARVQYASKYVQPQEMEQHKCVISLYVWVSGCGGEGSMDYIAVVNRIQPSGGYLVFCQSHMQVFFHSTADISQPYHTILGTHNVTYTDPLLGGRGQRMCCDCNNLLYCSD